MDVLGHLLDEHHGRLVLPLDGQRGFLEVEDQLPRQRRVADLRLQLLGKGLDALARLVCLLLQLNGLILGGLIVHDTVTSVYSSWSRCRCDRAVVPSCGPGSPRWPAGPRRR